MNPLHRTLEVRQQRLLDVFERNQRTKTNHRRYRDDNIQMKLEKISKHLKGLKKEYENKKQNLEQQRIRLEDEFQRQETNIDIKIQRSKESLLRDRRTTEINSKQRKDDNHRESRRIESQKSILKKEFDDRHRNITLKRGQMKTEHERNIRITRKAANNKKRLVERDHGQEHMKVITLRLQKDLQRNKQTIGLKTQRIKEEFEQEIHKTKLCLKNISEKRNKSYRGIGLDRQRLQEDYTRKERELDFESTLLNRVPTHGNAEYDSEQYERKKDILQEEYENKLHDIKRKEELTEEIFEREEQEVQDQQELLEEKRKRNEQSIDRELEIVEENFERNMQQLETEQEQLEVRLEIEEEQLLRKEEEKLEHMQLEYERKEQQFDVQVEQIEEDLERKMQHIDSQLERFVEEQGRNQEMTETYLDQLQEKNDEDLQQLKDHLERLEYKFQEEMEQLDLKQELIERKFREEEEDIECQLEEMEEEIENDNLGLHSSFDVNVVKLQTEHMVETERTRRLQEEKERVQREKVLRQQQDIERLRKEKQDQANQLKSLREVQSGQGQRTQVGYMAASIHQESVTRRSNTLLDIMCCCFRKARTQRLPEIVVKDVAVKPLHWTPMGDSEVKTERLQTSYRMYRMVKDLFKETLPDHQIICIEKIQNWTLYQQYMAMKSQLDIGSPGTQNERKLWHGTDLGAIAGINMHGFNRRYCGKNATKYGEGVYFAVNATYSANNTFSQEDGNGLKRMYLARVLTGKFTKGSESLKVPPAISPAHPHILYDSVVDNVTAPNMFVIFKDVQAYPEYLVTFTE